MYYCFTHIITILYHYVACYGLSLHIMDKMIHYMLLQIQWSWCIVCKKCSALSHLRWGISHNYHCIHFKRFGTETSAQVSSKWNGIHKKQRIETHGTCFKVMFVAFFGDDKKIYMYIYICLYVYIGIEHGQTNNKPPMWEWYISHL